MDSNINRPLHFLQKIFTGEGATSTLLIVLLVLVPVFFIPSVLLTSVIAKSALISIGILLSFISFLVILIRKGQFVLPRNYIFLGMGALLVTYLASSFGSSSIAGSFLGYGFEVSTFAAILLGCVLTYLVAVSFNDSKKIFTAFAAFLTVAGILAVVQSLLLLFVSAESVTGGGFLSFIVNTVGKTNELAIFFGVSGVLSLIALEILRLNKLYRIILYVILVLSFLVIAIINFLTVWFILGAVLILFFVYQIAFLNAVTSRMTIVPSVQEGTTEPETKLQSPRKKFPLRTLIFGIIALVFIVPSFFGADLGQVLSSKFGFSSLEVRPSWQATHLIFKNSIAENPIIGAGPNRFATQWQLYRPDVNLTDFWNVNFDSGIGYVPTSMVETGILGTLAWAIFFLTILFVGFKALYAKIADPTTRYLVTSSFAATLFLWVANIVYTPGPTLLFLTFFFTGLFISSAIIAGVGTHVPISLVGRPKISFVFVAVSVCLLLASVAFGYIVFERARSFVYFQRGSRVANTTGDIDASVALVTKAASIAKNDVYYRAIANINILKLNNLLSVAAGKTDVSEAEKLAFQTSLEHAVSAARSAIESDPANFENKIVTARVYETLIPVQIEGAYETSKSLFEDALKLSPRNPSIYLSLAKIEAAKNNLTTAEGYVRTALELKWNYPDAIFLQSQIDVSKGNLPAAIKSVEQIATLTPQDPSIYFRLGLLQYESKNFSKAVTAFEKSISLVPVYANAKYFLGLSYAKVGRTADAIAQFVELQSSNPGNQEINTVLANLRLGRDPFANSEEEVAPEKRKELPVKETASSKTP